MSTNINIDVTLQKLQQVANETTEKNREEKKARDEDLAIEAKAAELSGERDGSVPPIEDLVDSLGEPLSRTGEPPSEKQKPNEADKSSVPDLYKKLDPGAGAVPLFRPVHGWLKTTGINEYTIYSADGSQSIAAPKTPTFGNPFADLDLPSFAEIASESVISNVQLVLPLDKNYFVYASYSRVKIKTGYRYATPGQNGVQFIISGVTTRSGTVAQCFLVGLTTVKERPMPGLLESKINRINPLDQTEDIFLPAVIPSTASDATYEWLFRPIRQDTIYEQGAAPLYSHYLNAGITSSGTPAIYWYLSNYSDSRDRDEWLSGTLTPEFIRETYSNATYGANRGNKWYFPEQVLEPATQDQPEALKLDWYQQRSYDDFSPDTIRRIANYGPFSRARVPVDFYGSELLTAWDVNVPGYCRQQLLALGFTEDDLTP